MRRIFSLGIFICLLVAHSPLYGGGLPSVKNIKNLNRHSRLSLRKAFNKLAQRNRDFVASARERKYQSELFNKARRATFRALPKKHDGLSNPFTGTTFWVSHKGQKEIFGVIAAHTLQDVYVSSGMLGKEFNAVVINGNVAHTIPAEVVQFTPPSMGDLALIKFPAKYESVLHPLKLETVELSLPAQGYSQGYATNVLSKQVFPIVGKTSQGAFISDLPAAELGDRAGLCGSPVFTTDFQWAGIHVGSSYKTNEGYITPVSVLQNLVKSYYNPQIQPQSIFLAGKKIGQLAMDEFVASLEFLNVNQQTLWKYDTHSKFSVSKAQEKLTQVPGVAFIRLTIGRARWTDATSEAYIMYDEVFNSRIITVPWPAR